uniref:Poly(A)-specific ribonuclease PARN n=1 Tax=Parascaris univalens TaxID=6257 RepID=A0A915AFZ7_PARUN
MPQLRSSRVHLILHSFPSLFSLSPSRFIFSFCCSIDFLDSFMIMVHMAFITYKLTGTFIYSLVCSNDCIEISHNWNPFEIKLRARAQFMRHFPR